METKDFLLYASQSFDEDYIPDTKALQKISEQICLSPSEPLFKISCDCLRSLGKALCRKLEINQDSIPRFIDKVTKAEEKNLSTIIKETFLLTEVKEQKSYLYLSNSYFLRYHLEKQPADIEKALQLRLHWLEKNIDSDNAWRYFYGAKKYIPLLATQTNKKKYDNLFFWLEKLLHIYQLQSTKHIIGELELLSLRVDRSFLPNFIRHGFYRMSHNISLDLEKAICKILMPHKKLVAKLPNVKYLLFDRLGNEKHSYPELYELILHLIPFYSEGDQSGILSLLTQSAGKRGDIKTKKILSRLISGYALLMPEELCIEFLKEAINDESSEIKSLTFQTMGRLWRFFTDESKDDLCTIMLNCFIEVIVEQDRKDAIERCTHYLMRITLENGELLEPIADKWILAFKEKPDHPSLFYTLEILLPGLPRKSRQKISLLLEKMHNRSSLMLFISRLGIFWDYLEAPDLILPKELSHKESRIVAIKGFANAISKIKISSRTVLLRQLLDMALNNKDDVALQQALLPTLAKVSCYFSPATTEEIGQIFLLKLVRFSQDDVVETAIKNIHYLLPFVHSEIRERTHNLLGELLRRQAVSLELAANILYCLPQFPRSFNEAKAEELVGWITQVLDNAPVVFQRAAFNFITKVWEIFSDESQQKILTKTHKLASQPSLAESAIALLVKCTKGDDVKIAAHASNLQNNSYTWHLAFALYEIYPDILEKVPNLEKNYERIRNQDPFQLGLKISRFHLNAHLDERAKELLDWILSDTITVSIKRKALHLLYIWHLHNERGPQALKKLEELHKLGYYIN